MSEKKNDPPEQPLQRFMDWLQQDPWVRGGLLVSMVVILILLILLATRPRR
jgi:hypothetical protein